MWHAGRIILFLLMRLRLQGTSREWKHENLSLDLSGFKALFLTAMLYTHAHTLNTQHTQMCILDTCEYKVSIHSHTVLIALAGHEPEV